ncbi:MAG: site-specific DNA-methyltransferase [Myxococcales bacterium]|nr:site-specific DNA-methyltransferase [Myxococcales bacterium]HQY62232.1 site-specific DNA-methyltransferase [Polyangiaceae bacterium]
MGRPRTRARTAQDGNDGEERERGERALGAATPHVARSEVRLCWPGRDDGARAEAPPADLHVVERHREAPDVRLAHGDALALAGALTREGLAGRVDLVYLDPPYFSDADYSLEARLDGTADGRTRRAPAYGDRWARGGPAGSGGLAAYLGMLAPRLEALAALLAPTGTFWVHLDWRASYLVRVLLDEIFGKDAFLNEIVWKRAPNLGRQAASGQFGRTLDTLVVYGGPDARLVPPTRPEPIARGAVRFDAEGRAFTTAPRGDYTDASVERLEAEGRIFRAPSGKVYVKYFLQGDEETGYVRERRVDALWNDIPPLRHAAASERTGYPTQKPVALLERVLLSGSPPGGLVVDAFAGSGTTGEAALRTGRRAILGDGGAVAIATARARLLRAGARLEVSRDAALPAMDALPVVATAERGARGEAIVRLVEPEEPLAWAIDPAPTALFPFSPTWHSERSLGKRVTPAARETTVAWAGGPLAVQVYADDGRVGHARLEVRR